MRYSKLEAIERVMRHGLPLPRTIFVLDWQKQAKEVEEFLNGREWVSIRTDKPNAHYCPNNLECPAELAAQQIKQFLEQGYAVILSEYVPFNALASGNCLVLSQRLIVECMRGSPLTLLNRYGKLDEHLQLDRRSGRVLFHWGEFVLSKEQVNKVFELFNRNDFLYCRVEFAFGPDWFYVWEIRKDESSRLLDT